MLSNALFRAFAAIDLTEALRSVDKIDTNVKTQTQTMGCFGAINGSKYNTSKVGVEEEHTGQQYDGEKVLAKLNQEVRLQFVRKVFGIVTIQLLLTFSICLISTIEPLATSLRSYWYLMFFPFTIAMIIYCYLVLRNLFRQEKRFDLLGRFRLVG